MRGRRVIGGGKLWVGCKRMRRQEEQGESHSDAQSGSVKPFG